MLAALLTTKNNAKIMLGGNFKLKVQTAVEEAICKISVQVEKKACYNKLAALKKMQKEQYTYLQHLSSQGTNTNGVPVYTDKKEDEYFTKYKICKKFCCILLLFK